MLPVYIEEKRFSLDDGGSGIPPLDDESSGGSHFRPIKLYFLLNGGILQPEINGSRTRVYTIIHQPKFSEFLAGADKEHYHLKEFDIPGKGKLFANSEISNVIGLATDLIGNQEKNGKLKEVKFVVSAYIDHDSGYMQPITDDYMNCLKVGENMKRISIPDIQLFAYGFNGF